MRVYFVLSQFITHIFCKHHGFSASGGNGNVHQIQALDFSLHKRYSFKYVLKFDSYRALMMVYDMAYCSDLISLDFVHKLPFNTVLHMFLQPALLLPPGMGKHFIYWTPYKELFSVTWHT